MLLRSEPYKLGKRAQTFFSLSLRVFMTLHSVVHMKSDRDLEFHTSEQLAKSCKLNNKICYLSMPAFAFQNSYKSLLKNTYEVGDAV